MTALPDDDMTGVNGAKNSSDSLPSLLEQCEALSEEGAVLEPVRSIHHLACTGGTLISKCLAVIPNVTLLSEIDPLSRMNQIREGSHTFWPTDPIHSARVALRPIGENTAEAMFMAALSVLHRDVSERGGHLVLRDHTHSQFCTEVDPDTRPTLGEMLAKFLPLLSVITVRHPLDSFLSLDANGWTDFQPFTLEEYARRNLLFLARYEGVALFRYENFIEDPRTMLTEICAALDLPAAADAESFLDVVALTGDSGRRSSQIGQRPRREIPERIAMELEDSPTYAALCARLGYEPDTR